MEGGKMKDRILLISAYVLISAIMVINPSITKADILVYDNNNQRLGILVNMGDNELDLFIPSLSGTFKYSTHGYSGWCGDELDVYFESSDCSGTPYSASPLPLIFDFSPVPIEGFYKVDYSGKKTITPGSSYAFQCACTAETVLPAAEYYPYVQVQMPFTAPITLPLRFEVRTRTAVIPLF